MATPIPPNDAPIASRDAAVATGGVVVRDSTSAARGITSDSRAVVPGMAFVAIRGARYDGHDYVEAAVRAGACLVVVERGRAPLASGVGVVEVSDTLIAWADLAKRHVAAWRREHSARVVAITGSAGKTTTKELCAALLRTAGVTHATAGNLNNRVGVPAVAFGLKSEHRFAVFELGMSERGEIAELARIVEPDVGVITNVGVAHAAGVGGGREDVAREKGALFAALPEASVAIAPFEDALARAQISRTRAKRVVTFGTSEGADIRLVDRVQTGFGGATLRITRRDVAGAQAVRFPLPGFAAAIDFVAALAASEAIIGRLDDQAIASALSHHLSPPPGRMQVCHLADGTVIVDDTYNANPASVRAALQTLAELSPDRPPVVVLGEMRELGDRAADEHRSLGEAIVQSRARVAVSCGGLAELAIDAAEQAGIPSVRAASAIDAAARIVTLVRPGDVVLVKASRGVGAECIVRALVQARGVLDAPGDAG